MDIAIVTLDGFNELDSFIASAILNRVNLPDWTVSICGATEEITSMNGAVVKAQKPLDFANRADVVLFGSGIKTAEFASDKDFLSRFSLDPTRQLIGSQCSGALLLHKLGLVSGLVATDTTTAPFMAVEGVKVSGEAFHAEGNVATAGGCLSSQYLAAWVIASKTDWQSAADIIHYIAPIGQKEEYVARAKSTVLPWVASGEKVA
jgi:transcriptional regulator GlxA family with amidase domain